LRHGKSQQPRLLPDFNGLNKSSSREDAVPHGAGALAANFGALRISDPQPEEPFGRFRQIRERDHVLPDLRRIGIHLDSGSHFHYRSGRSFPVFEAEQHWDCEKRRAGKFRCVFAAPRLNEISHRAADERDAARQRRRHQEANDPFESKREQTCARASHRQERRDHAITEGSRPVISVDQDGDESHGERCPHEEPPAIDSQKLRPQGGRAHGQDQ